MKISLRTYCSITACCALIVSLGLAACHYQPSGEQTKIALKPPPQGAGHRPRGMNAIYVKASGGQTFTKQDVVTYFKTHNLPMNMTPSSQFHVDSLEFLTNDQVSARLEGASPGVAPGEKVAFATLSGVFVFTGPPPGKPARFSRAYAVFDASTGNLLMIGTLQQEQGTPGR
jgi:hypothetical protein